MNTENRIARFMRNSGPARALVPAGIILLVFGLIMLCMNTGSYELTTGRITSVDPGSDKKYDVSFTYTVNGTTYEGSFDDIPGEFTVGGPIDVYYNPEKPGNISNSKGGAFGGLLFILAGIAVAGYGIMRSGQAFRKSRELDETTPGAGTFPEVDFGEYRISPGVTEYYFRFDGNSLRPGYIIEDAERNVIFEGKMKKNAVVGSRVFEFANHVTGSVTEHEVGHTVTESFNNEFFSASSWFKYDVEKIWDVLHGHGLRMVTDMRSRFPYFVYNVSRDGEPFAVIETSSIYVHEDEEAQHKIVIPAGKMYYRFWTSSGDFDLLFLTIFAISETEQAVVE